MSEVHCGTCNGACCSDIVMPLTTEDADRLTQAGTVLSVIPVPTEHHAKDGLALDDEPTPKWTDTAVINYLIRLAIYEELPETRTKIFKVVRCAQQMDPGEELYEMIGSCGFLQDDYRCATYESRPDICVAFEVGGTACLSFREQAGVDVPVSLSAKPI